MITEIINEEAEKFISELPESEKKTAETYFREGMITAYTRMFAESLHKGINFCSDY